VNGEIAQLVALVTHGNAWLVDGGRAPELFPAHTTFQFVADIRFADLAGSTAAWFERLRDRRVRRLRLALPSVDPRFAGLAGGVAGKIVTEAGRREAWTPAWSVKDAHAPDQRVWSVTYARRRVLRRLRPGTPIADATHGLERALVAAEDFAQWDRFLSMFASSFVEARDLLAASEPAIPYHHDLVPPSWDLGGRRLLAAAGRAWVFGGMGSWNDVYFEEDSARQAYATLSRDLYAAITTAIVAAANAPAPRIS
jgi:hypothetical protein